MLKLIAPFVILFVAIFLVVASDKPDPPADFTFINRGDVTTLDPQRMSWMQDLRVARLLFEPLVRLDVLSADPNRGMSTRTTPSTHSISATTPSGPTARP